MLKTKAAVMEALDEFAANDAAIRKLEAKRAAEMEPIQKKYESRFAKLYSERGELETAVTEYLEKKNIDQIILAQSGAVAEQRTETKTGSRSIDPQKFVAAAKSKGAALWECVSVGVAKAVKLLGEEEIDKIATKKETVTVIRTLRMQ